MALYRYDGPFEEVSVHVAGNEVGTVEKGGSIAISDELASLTEWQDYWTRADTEPAEKVSAPVALKEGK